MGSFRRSGGGCRQGCSCLGQVRQLGCRRSRLRDGQQATPQSQAAWLPTLALARWPTGHTSKSGSLAADARACAMANRPHLKVRQLGCRRSRLRDGQQATPQSQAAWLPTLALARWPTGHTSKSGSLAADARACAMANRPHLKVRQLGCRRSRLRDGRQATPQSQAAWLPTLALARWPTGHLIRRPSRRRLTASLRDCFNRQGLPGRYSDHEHPTFPIWPTATFA